MNSLDQDGLRQQLDMLRDRLAQLEQENSDLDIAMQTAIEHGDAIESELTEMNERLHAEIANRLRAETRLERLLTILTEQKADLEILIATITEHADGIDAEWLQRYGEIEEISRTDGLTGIANRRALTEALDREWRRALRAGLPLSVILADLDHFKYYNDALGHQAGDACLKKVAAVLRGACRRSGDLPGRYGGEEFLLILPNTNLEGALGVDRQIREELARLALAHPASPHEQVTLSSGIVSEVPSTERDTADMLASVDRLLYAAKRDGRNTYKTPVAPSA